MAQPIADYLVSLDNGQVKAQGTVSEALRADPKLFIEAKVDEGKEEMAEEIDAVEGPVDAKPSAEGKLILAEEKAEGHLSLSALKLLCTSLGGPIFWVTILIAFAADQGAILVQTWWLGNWSRQYEVVADPKSVSVAYYLGIYCLTVLAGTVAMCIGFTVWTFGAVRSGMIIHRKVRLGCLFPFRSPSKADPYSTSCSTRSLLRRCVGSTRPRRAASSSASPRTCAQLTASSPSSCVPFLQVSALSRAKLTFRISCAQTSAVLEMGLSLLTKLFAIALVVPLFSLSGLLVGIIGGFIAELCQCCLAIVCSALPSADTSTPAALCSSPDIHAQMSIKREMSNTKAPLFSTFGDALGGLVSVRAYGAEQMFRDEAQKRVDKYLRTAVSFYNLNRWCNVRCAFSLPTRTC